MNKLGMMIRQIRNDRGLSLDKVSGEDISPASISNFETGKQKLKPTKLQSLLIRLGFDSYEDLQEEWSVTVEKGRLKLLHLERVIYSLGPDFVLKETKSMKIDSHHPYKFFEQFLRGKALLLKKKYAEAEICLLTCLQILDEHPEYKRLNIGPAAFCELARIRYLENDFASALSLIEKGLSSFVPGKKRTHLKHVLLLTKAILKDRQGKWEEAKEVIELLKESSCIDSLDVRIQIQEFEASFLIMKGKYSEAKEIIENALWLARINNLENRIVELYSLQGKIQFESDQSNLAAHTYQMAITMKNIKSQMIDPKYFITPHRELAVIYMSQRDFKKAEKEALEAVKLGKKEKGTRYGKSLVVLGDILRQSGRFKEAAEMYDEAITLFSQLDIEEFIQKARSGHVLCTIKEDGHFNSSSKEDSPMMYFSTEPPNTNPLT